MQKKSRSRAKARLRPFIYLALALKVTAVPAGGLDVAPDHGVRSGLFPFSLGAPKTPAAKTFLVAAAEKGSGSRDALFGDDDLIKRDEKPGKGDNSTFKGIHGFLQLELARSYQEPVHWSKMLTRADVSAQGSLGTGVKWKLGVRADYDAVHSLYNFYPGDVARDQRFNLVLRENYLDVGAGDWDFRLGKQHVVWGEMVGLFFADVVSARDMREFILPEFDTMRIPQWAARAEYFKGDFHAELLWIPVASYDETGKPGAEFFPDQLQPPGIAVQYRNEVFPKRKLSNTNYGIRLSAIKNGWDISSFAYSSMDISPTFYRDAVSLPGTFIYEARHDRINQFGATVTKDFGFVMLKGETVYTRGRQFPVLRLADANGVAPQNTLDWAVGFDFTLPAETRLNAQVFQRDFFSYDSDLLSDKHETGYSLLLNHKFSDKLEAQVIWISSFNRTDWLLRPRITWNFERNWRLAIGADVFKGPALGLLGRFDGSDRVYSEVRYSF